MQERTQSLKKIVGNIPAGAMFAGSFVFLLVELYKYAWLKQITGDDHTSESTQSLLLATQHDNCLFIAFGSVFLVLCTVGYYLLRNRQISLGSRIVVYIHVIASALPILAISVQSIVFNTKVIQQSELLDGIIYIDHSLFINLCILILLGAQLLAAVAIITEKVDYRNVA